jgi:hypothetical protein
LEPTKIQFLERKVQSIPKKLSIFDFRLIYCFIETKRS